MSGQKQRTTSGSMYTHHPRTFIATGRRGIARASHKHNGQWDVGQLLADRDVRCLALDPLQNNVLYAGTQGRGMLRSDDAGLSWEKAGLDGLIVKSIAASPIEKGLVYAGTKPPCLFVSDNGGRTWDELDSFRRIPSRRFWFSPAEAPGTAYVQAIALSPANTDVLLAGIEFGAVVRCEDGGKNWSGHRRKALRDCHTMLFHATDGNWVYEAGGSGGGAAVSRDAGNTWTKIKGGLDRRYGWACTADPGNPNIWYCSASPSPFKAHSAGNAQAGIFRSTNGAAWQRIGNGLPDPLPYMPYALLTTIDAPGHIYAGLSNGEVWHSEHYGDSWSRLPFRFDEIHRTMILIPL